MNLLLKNGKISLQDVEREIHMMRLKEYVDKYHKQKIWTTEDGIWRTHIYIDGERKLRARHSEDDLYKLLYEFYSGGEQSVNHTFKKMFGVYKEYKSKFVHENTVAKYEVDYKRFFSNTELENKFIEEIDEEYVRVFLVDRIKLLKLNKKAYEAMYGYFKAVFKYCKMKKIIVDNPFDYIERKEFYQYCFNPKINHKDRVISKSEMNDIIGFIDSQHIEHPEYIVPYAVELASYTGMRVGEIAALKWEDIDFENHSITVNKAEIYCVKSKEYTIGETKNGVERIVPMVEECEELLRTIKKVEMQYGWLDEFVFCNENGRIHKFAMSKCAGVKSLQAGLTKRKGMHSHRRTLNSNLKANGVPTVTAAAILGHTEDVNERNYTYDTTSMDHKRNLLKMAISG